MHSNHDIVCVILTKVHFFVNESTQMKTLDAYLLMHCSCYQDSPLNETKGVTIQTKALSEFIPMILYMFVLSLKRVHFLANETQKCDHSNESS